MNNLATIEKEQPAELTLLRRAEELAVYVSAHERRLVKSGGATPIQDLPPMVQRERVEALLGFVFRDLGLRTAPTPYDVERLLDYCGEHHPRFTTADLKSAFDLFLAGKLEGLPEGHDHYQAFSVAFYGKVFRSYAKAQQAARHDVRHKVQKAQMLLQAPALPAELIEHRALTLIRSQVAAYLETGVDRVAMVGFTHDWLVRLGVCSVVEAPTKEEREGALIRLRNRNNRAVSFSWAMQRILSGEKVDDVDWEAHCHKRSASMWRELDAQRETVLGVLDCELAKIQARAAEKGVTLDLGTAAA